MLLSLFKNSNQAKKNLLITGEDAFLNDYLVRDYVKNPALDQLEKRTVDCESEGIGELIADLTEASLFASEKLLIVKNPIFLTGKVQKKDEKNLKQLEKIFEKIDQSDDQLVIICNGKIDKRRKISKICQKNFNLVDVSFKPYEVSGILKAIIKTENYQISQSALQLLLERSDQVMEAALSNYLKLKNIATDQKITTEMINANIDLSLAQNIFEILTKALSHNYQEAILRLEDQLREGQSPIRILAVFESQLEVLLAAKILLARSRSEMDVGKELGIHPYRVKLAGQTRISIKSLEKMLLAAIKLDYGYKNGTYQGPEFLKMFLLAV
ncbi:DNA polymerase III, delta subunit [Lactobacillus psittaci DSM 15354]|uniref:DNA polymerase III subunit delta n=1 Tax=Lactobacillus psittaci DSM 15354 TaxID=1122152 RepID=A0A0R1S2Z0_9LACO|nr:DNA polymerase III, delta subunit [Lactobacillus psittaci DSM 15354]